MDANSKAVWKSKTWFFSLVLASFSEFHPHFKGWVSTHPDTAMLLVIAAYVSLRHISTVPLYFFRIKSS